jgi:hypothetical protein
VEQHDRKSMYTKCFDSVAPKSVAVKSVKRNDPQYEAPADVHAEVRGPTVRNRVAPTAVVGHVNPRLLELAKYGR